MLCVLNKTTQTPIKYSSRVPAAETLAKWNPFLLNRRVIKLIAALVLNWLALHLPSINHCLSRSCGYCPPMFDAANERGGTGDDERSCLTRSQLCFWPSLSFFITASNLPVSLARCLSFLYLSPTDVSLCVSLSRRCCLTSLTRTMTRLRSPEEMAKLSSTETDSEHTRSFSNKIQAV